MRTFIIIALLSALAACYGAAVLPSEKVMSEGITIVYDEDSPNGRIMSRSDTVDNLFVLLSESSINVPAIPGKMRSFIIITVLSALAACCSASVLPNEEEMITVVYDENFPNGTIVSKEELDSRFSRVVAESSGKKEDDIRLPHKMRSFIVIAVLSALATCYGASVVPSEDEYITTIYDEKSPNGTIVSNGDIEFRNERSSIFAQWHCEAPSVVGQSQTITLKYLGDSSERITRRVTTIYGQPQMRTFIIITVLSALAACCSASILPSEEEMITVVYDDESPNGRILSNAELHNSIIPNNFVLLAEWRCDAPSINGQVQRVGVRYDGDPNVQISQVSVTYYSPAPRIDRSPLGRNFMEVNITTPVGREVWSTMRSFIIITVLSAFAACYGVSDLMNEEVQERYTMLYDEKTPNGRIVSDTELNKITEEISILAQWYCQAPALPDKQQRMRSFIIIAVLSALAACYGTPVLPSAEETYPEYKMIHKYNKEDDAQNRITMLREEMRHDNDRQNGEVLLDV
ncbi:unnamed protein product [Spodoptera littoralis]|uniref:Uncharacterized protein n=1 Tax=Spodoptera littoralis TaxID=7109 RepID=A0A9P0N5K1_SPOLI|nr:unnamed protein product [Spodoptera littoralis]CAH1640695.1 unnamed protein product [Spodoptera littoralis]